MSHLAGLIEAYFGDGTRWGVKITYAREETPLGTVGPIAMLDHLDENFLIMNGDVLTNLDYRHLMNEHLARGAIATLTSCRKGVPISLGVVEVSPDHRLLDYIEKPVLDYQASMGIYALSRRVVQFVPRGQRSGSSRSHALADPEVGAGPVLRVQGRVARHRAPRGLRRGTKPIRRCAAAVRAGAVAAEEKWLPGKDSNLD